VIVPDVAPEGTTNFSFDDETHVTTVAGVPFTVTTRVAPAAPKPLPVTVTVAPTAAVPGLKLRTFGSTVNAPLEVVVPPAFVTAIGPLTPPVGIVTLSDVLEATLKVALTPPILTEDVPEKVAPASVTTVPVTPWSGLIGSVIVGRIASFVVLAADVPPGVVTVTLADTAFDGTVSESCVAEIGEKGTATDPTFTAVTPAKFAPVTVTTSPARAG
jgi:hypothetical protein